MIGCIVADILPYLHTLSHKFCHNVEDCNDLVGETVLRLLTAKQYDGRSIKPYAAITMRNIFLNTCKAQRYTEEIDDRVIGADERADGASDVLERVYSLSGTSSCIKAAVLRGEGYSYDEIGTMQDIGIGTVKSRVKYGREMLKKLFGS